MDKGREGAVGVDRCPFPISPLEKMGRRDPEPETRVQNALESTILSLRLGAGARIRKEQPAWKR